MGKILNSMTRGSICSAIMTLLMNCESKPFKPDFDVAHFTIIGREKCYIDTVKNGWLISLTFLSSGNSYGPDISYGGVTYKNVVKTYFDLSKQYADSIDYACDFKVVESHSAQCEVASPEFTDVPTAEILELSVRSK